MRCRVFCNALIFLSVSLLFPLGARAEQVLKVMDGRVKEISSEKHELVLSYRHPVSGQMEEKTFEVDTATGFPEGMRFQDLRPNQPLSVDYQEGPQGKAHAVRIRAVPLRGVPIDRKVIF